MQLPYRPNTSTPAAVDVLLLRRLLLLLLQLLPLLSYFLVPPTTPSSWSSMSLYSCRSWSSVSESGVHMPRPAASSMRRSTLEKA